MLGKGAIIQNVTGGLKAKLRACQQHCAKTPGCAHFTLATLSLACDLASKFAVKSFTPTLGFTSGPPSCTSGETAPHPTPTITDDTISQKQPHTPSLPHPPQPPSIALPTPAGVVEMKFVAQRGQGSFPGLLGPVTVGLAAILVGIVSWLVLSLRSLSRGGIMDPVRTVRAACVTQPVPPRHYQLLEANAVNGSEENDEEPDCPLSSVE